MVTAAIPTTRNAQHCLRLADALHVGHAYTAGDPRREPADASDRDHHARDWSERVRAEPAGDRPDRFRDTRQRVGTAPLRKNNASEGDAVNKFDHKSKLATARN